MKMEYTELMKLGALGVLLIQVLKASGKLSAFQSMLVSLAYGTVVVVLKSWPIGEATQVGDMLIQILIFWFVAMGVYQGADGVLSKLGFNINVVGDLMKKKLNPPK
jgi:uncharacterized membrane protein